MTAIATTFRDARPLGDCTQTYFRNLGAIRLAIGYAIAGGHKNLNICDIGSGMIEPFLVGALCESFRVTGQLRDYKVHCWDRLPAVVEGIDHFTHGRPFAIDGQVLVDSQGLLQLSGLAQMFRSTTQPVNEFLTASGTLDIHLQRWIDAGLAPYFYIDPFISHMHHGVLDWLQRGFAVIPPILERVDATIGDIGIQALPWVGQAHLVISNYALQYPLWQGYGNMVVANLDRAMAPDAIVQISNAYSAQALLLKGIAETNTRLGGHTLTVALREIMVIDRYHDDGEETTPRLIARTDMLFAPVHIPPHRPSTGELEHFTRWHAGTVCPIASVAQLSAVMQEHYGGTSDELCVFYAYFDPQQATGFAYLLPVQVLLQVGRLPFRFDYPYCGVPQGSTLR